MRVVPAWLNWLFLGLIAVALAVGFLFYPSPQAKQISIIVALFEMYALVGIHLATFALRNVSPRWREFAELVFAVIWIGGPYVVLKYVETDR